MTKNQLPPVLRRWRFFAVAMGVTALAGGGVLLAANADPATALAFHTVPATRVLDTRAASQVGAFNTPLAAASTLDFVVLDLPDDATAVSLNVTVTDGTQASFLVVYPTGSTRPGTSTVNWSSVNAVANTATVNVPANHSLQVYNNQGSVNVIIDLLGYYAPSPVGGAPGPQGPQGIQGVQGPLGPVGPAGSDALVGPAGSVYLYANNTTAETIPVGVEVAFDTVVAALGGITVDLAGSGFTVTNAGVYKVSFGVVGDAENQVDILVDEAVPASGALVFGGTGGIANEGTAVLSLLAGETVSLANLNSGVITGVEDLVLSDAPFGGTATELNAWIVIEQLNS